MGDQPRRDVEGNSDSHTGRGLALFAFNYGFFYLKLIHNETFRILLPAAFVTVTESSVDEHEIRKYAQETLPVHLQPSKIHIVKQLPVTKAGKTDYNKLEQLTISGCSDNPTFR